MKKSSSDKKSLIHKSVQAKGKKTISFLQDLISIPTVNPPGENYETCVNFLVDKLKSLGLKTKLVRVPWEDQKKLQPNYKDYPRWNVVARYDVGAKKTIHMNAHYDVVPVSGKWKFGPFEPKVKDGWIYGRGSADMKGSISSCLLALEVIIGLGLKPNVNIEISFTADEETGGHLGAGYIVKKKLIKADYAVVMEGGHSEFLGLGHNGVLWLEGKLKGKAAHGALPQKGINALEHMHAVLSEIFPLRDSLKRRSFHMKGLETMHPTMNVGGVIGSGTGAKVNTVPAEARFTIDRRLVANEKLKDAKEEIVQAAKKAKKKFPSLSLEFDTLFACDPCVSPPDLAFVKTAKQTLETVLAKKAQYELCVGFTDLHYFVVEGGLSGIGYGPDGENWHGVDERVKVSEILKTAEVYANLFLADF